MSLPTHMGIHGLRPCEGWAGEVERERPARAARFPSARIVFCSSLASARPNLLLKAASSFCSSPGPTSSERSIGIGVFAMAGPTENSRLDPYFFGT